MNKNTPKPKSKKADLILKGTGIFKNCIFHLSHLNHGFLRVLTLS